MDDLANRPFYAGEWRIDPPRGRLCMGAREFKVEPSAMAVMVYLASREGTVVSKQELLHQVWEGRAVSDDVLTVSIYRLRRILGDSARDPRFIATVPRRGYRWISPVHREGDDVGLPRETTPGELSIEPGGDERPPAGIPTASWPRFTSSLGEMLGGTARQWRSGRGVLLAGLLLLSATAGFLGLRGRHSAGPSDLPAQARATAASAASPADPESTVSLAVLPFADLGPDAEFVYFAEGLSTALVDILVRSKEIQVSGRASSAAAQRQGWTIPEIGRQLGVRYVLEGSVQRDDRKLRVTVQLSDAVDGFYVWSGGYVRELGDVFDVQSEIATAIAETLGLHLPTDPSAAARGTPSLEAYEAYLRGRHFLHQGGKQPLLQAEAHFGRAIEIDGDYAAAYSGLADTYLLLPVYSRGSRRTYHMRAWAAAERALELDDQLAEAHTSRAEVRLWLERDVAGAEAGLRRAIELDPHYSTAHYRLGELLFWRLDRLDEALDHIQLAERGDPLNLLFKKSRGQILLESGSIQQARSKFLEAAEADASYPEAIYGLARCAFAERRYGEAVEYLERFLRLEQDGRRGYLRPAQFETLTAARHLLGDHERELRDALSAQAATPEDPWPLQMEARARSALGQSAAVRDIVKRILEMPQLTGGRARWLLRLVAELHWHGDPETARWVASELAGWYRGRDSDCELGQAHTSRFLALALWQSGQYESADDLFESALRNPHLCENCRSDYIYLGEVGSLAARAGDRDTAARYSALLGELENRADALFWQAAIAASAGDRSRAVHLLRESFDSGFTDHAAVHSGLYFIDLHDYRPFHDLAASEWGWPPPEADNS